MRFTVPSGFLALAVALAACADPGPGTVTDDLGRTVALAGTPGAVVPLAPDVAELVAAAAGADRLAGVPDGDDLSPEIAGRPRFRSLPLDREAVVALGAGLAIGSDDATPTDAADGLAALGVPTYLFRFDEVADVPRALRTLDTLLAVSGGAPAAEAFEARVEAVRQAVAPYGRPRVLVLAGSEPGALAAFGRASHVSEAVRIAGGDNVTDVFSGPAAQPSAEEVLELSPFVILVAGADVDAASLVADHPALAETPAVREGRVFGIDPGLLRAGPRLVEGIERIARRLHPEAFAAGVA